ncbi:GDSL-type esterase/lipase family protein [Pseudopedobacter beijingensis]|uniref:GDSL-type esterase/lipase family protein n=1 Tax=Pseudopedobacter beijingensis TaxID=1207056 RepID=A0ABW4I7B3_9SPHI
MIRIIFTALLLIHCSWASLSAQVRKSLSYYSEETLDLIEATAAQKAKIKQIKSNTDEKLKQAKNDANLVESEKQLKYKEIYAEGTKLYNEVISEQQKEVLKQLHKKIQDENTKIGFAPIIDSTFKSKHFDQRMELFASFPIANKAIVFLGNSITERGVWNELIPGKLISNRGIGGDNTFGVLARLDGVLTAKPEKIFLMIGVNDLAGRGWPLELVLKNYTRIVNQILKQSPKTKLYIQSVLPIDEDMIPRFKGKSIVISKFNEELKVLAANKKTVYVNLHDQFKDEQGKIKPELTNDGIHLTPLAYSQWVNYLKASGFL